MGLSFRLQILASTLGLVFLGSAPAGAAYYVEYQSPTGQYVLLPHDHRGTPPGTGMDMDGDGRDELLSYQQTGSNEEAHEIVYWAVDTEAYQVVWTWTYAAQAQEVVTFLGFFDLDADAQREAMFLMREYASGYSHVVALDWQTNSIEWQRDWAVGVQVWNVADIDADGSPELVLQVFGPSLHIEVIGADFTVPAESTTSEQGLLQNHPNPFNPSTTIEYVVPKTDHLKLDVFSPTGRHICTLIDRELAAGVYAVNWNGCDANGDRLPSGVYFYTLDAAGERSERKMILLK